MDYLTQKLLAVLSRHTKIEDSKRDVYIYAINLLLYTVVSTLGLIAISATLSKTTEGIIIILIYYVNQTLGGGFHASTHLRCFFTMAILLLAGLLALELHPSRTLLKAIVLIAGIVLFIFPLILHQNKSYLLPRSKGMRIRSRIVVAIECLIIFIPNVFEAYFILNSYAIGMTISVVSRVSAVFLAHHRQKHDCN